MAAKHVEKKSGKVYIPETIALDTENEEKFEKDVEEIRKKKAAESNKRGVIYLGHIPRGFFEPQMRAFFRQFGVVTQIKLSRSKKTGGSKGYAFIEFKYEDVAKLVAETMNNYLMFTRLLKCEFLPDEKVHPEMFKGCTRKFSKPKADQVAANRQNSFKSDEKLRKIQKRLVNKQRATSKKLLSLGVQYSLDVQMPPPQPKKEKADSVKEATQKLRQQGMQSTKKEMANRRLVRNQSVKGAGIKKSSGAKSKISKGSSSLKKTVNTKSTKGQNVRKPVDRVN